jgi:hypothetical protein
MKTTRVFSIVRLVMAAGLVLTFFVSASAQSQPEGIVIVGSRGLGAEYQISTALAPDLDRYKPAVAYNSQRNEYLTVWHYHDTAHYWIEARIENGRGEPVGVVGTILHANTVGVYQPAVAYNALNNEYLIVWMKNTNGDGKTYEIWGNLFSADLSPKYNQAGFKIASWTNTAFWTPRVAWNSVRNEYMVIWSAIDVTNFFPKDVSQATLTANGDLIGSIILTSWQHPHQADLAYNPVLDEFLVVWRREAAPGDYDIWAARVAAGPGTVVVPPGEFAISLANEDELLPRVATNRYDRYIVVWQKAAPGACCDWDIYGREVSFQGNLLGYVNVIAGWGSADEMNPCVVAWQGNTREYLVGYERESSGWTETWAAFYHNGKNALEVNSMTFWLDNFGAANYAFWNATSPAGAAGKSGAMLAYQGDSAGDPTITQHIYGRVYSPYPIYLPSLRK